MRYFEILRPFRERVGVLRVVHRRGHIFRRLSGRDVRSNGRRQGRARRRIQHRIHSGHRPVRVRLRVSPGTPSSRF